MKPQITLVFPFESEISEEQLQDYLIKSLVGMNCFNLTLGKIIRINGSTGLYLFFDVKNGTDEVKELHNRLYNGMLQACKPNWLKQVEFMPHMTVGNFIDREKLDKAYEDIISVKDTFSTLVEKISVEIIDENENSIIEIEVNLY